MITEPIANISHACPTLVNAMGFEQVHIYKHWFVPLVRKYIAR
jgi:hypothetical protein